MRDVAAASYLDGEALYTRNIKSDNFEQCGIDVGLLTQMFLCLSSTVLFVLFKPRTGNWRTGSSHGCGSVASMRRCVNLYIPRYMAWQEPLADRNTFASNRALVANVVKYSLDGRLVIELKVTSAVERAEQSPPLKLC